MALKLIPLFLGASAFFAAAAAVGLVAMRDTYQRLHYPALIPVVCAPLLLVAVWLRTNDPQARLKMLMITVILLFTSSVITHAMARMKMLRDQAKESRA